VRSPHERSGSWIGRCGACPRQIQGRRRGVCGRGRRTQRLGAAPGSLAARIGRDARRRGFRRLDSAETRVGGVSGGRIRQRRASERFLAAGFGKDARRSGFRRPESAKTRVGEVSGGRRGQGVAGSSFTVAGSGDDARWGGFRRPSMRWGARPGLGGPSGRRGPGGGVWGGSPPKAVVRSLRTPARSRQPRPDGLPNDRSTARCRP
jgi:hypothetical protein